MYLVHTGIKNYALPVYTWINFMVTFQSRFFKSKIIKINNFVIIIIIYYLSIGPLAFCEFSDNRRDREIDRVGTNRSLKRDPPPPWGTRVRSHQRFHDESRSKINVLSNHWYLNASVVSLAKRMGKRTNAAESHSTVGQSIWLRGSRASQLR